MKKKHICAMQSSNDTQTAPVAVAFAVASAVAAAVVVAAAALVPLPLWLFLAGFHVRAGFYSLLRVIFSDSCLKPLQPLFFCSCRNASSSALRRHSESCSPFSSAASSQGSRRLKHAWTRLLGIPARPKTEISKQSADGLLSRDEP